MLEIKSREYKCMLNPQLFTDVETGISMFRKEFQQILRSAHVVTQGKFERIQQRTIAFFDTVDQSLRRNGLLLRRRTEAKRRNEYTLKCRKPDRLLAREANLSPAPGLKSKLKFEEDIATPFLSRYSQSATVQLESSEHRPPANLKAASRIFPCLIELKNDGHILPAETELFVVRNLKVREEVHTGPVLLLDPEDSGGQAEVAIILWSHKVTERLLVVEFSFRYDLDEQNDTRLAQSASTAFELLQQLDWCLPSSVTKTAFMYS